MPDTLPIAVIDLDGTVADVRQRLHYLQRQPKDWNAFFAGIADDPPLAEGLAVARMLADEHELVYLTGRPERYRNATLEWLRRHELPPGRLMMRGGGDRRPARVAKLAMLRSLHGVAVLVDDDADVCTAARAAGFPVLVADWARAPGDEQQELRTAQEREGRT